MEAIGKGNARNRCERRHFARVAVAPILDPRRRADVAPSVVHRTEQMAQETKQDDRQVIARNKRARHDYHILDSWEAGLVLTGTEVKSLRDGKATMADAYALVKDGEVFLLNLHISPYDKGNQFNHEPTRTRKVLLHRKEVRKLIGAVERQGLTLIPLELYFRNGVAKVNLALGKGKKLHDKRADDRKRTDEREMARVARTR